MKRIILVLLSMLYIVLFVSCAKKIESAQITSGDTIHFTETITPPAQTPTSTPIAKAPTITPTMETPTVVPTIDPSPTVTPKPTEIADAQEKDKNKAFTIVIDAGHQKHQNSDPEPIGPGAKKTKAKVSSGTQGRFTDIPEYEVNLEVSLKLMDILTQKGYKVIMVRETNDVDISNSERAEIANEQQADAFVRIHCNGSEDSSVNGILTISPTKNNPYCSQIYKDSRKLSDLILEALCDATGAKNKGVTETDTMSGINWSKVPVTIIEMGYMTNKKEDYKLTSSDYQDKLAEGIAIGIEEYLKQ